jgi:hypothetical protein
VIPAESVPAFEAFAARVLSAQDGFVATLMERGDLTRDEALAVFLKYRRAKVIKRDTTNNTWTVKHGALLDRETIRANVGG